MRRERVCSAVSGRLLTRWLNIVGTRAMHARGMLRSGQWAIPSVADVPQHIPKVK